MATHALLSPSSSGRWLICTPSARLEADHEDTSSEAAEEGTLAHRLGELMLQYRLKLITKKVYEAKLWRIGKNKLYSDTMFEYCEQYAVFVMEQYAEALEEDESAAIFLEVTIDLTEWVPEGFGTGDVVIICNGTFRFIDLKYGKGVKVEAEDNKQLKLYALGIYDMYSPIYDATEIIITIYQPRIDNISSWVISVQALLSWAEYVRKQAGLAWEGKGKFVPGNHCGFCRIKNSCSANADYQMELAKYEFREGIYLKPKQIADILNKRLSFINWLESINKYALAEVMKGKKIPGYKLVQGKSSRVLTEIERIKKILKAKGYQENDFLSTPSLLGIVALEKNIGAAKLKKLIGKYIIKPEGSPTLAVLSDNRPAYDATEAAKKIFSDE